MQCGSANSNTSEVKVQDRSAAEPKADDEGNECKDKKKRASKRISLQNLTET
jgi:hypothetical protein